MSTLSIAQPLLILDGKEKDKIGKYSSILEDSTNQFTIDSILKYKDKFKLFKYEVFNHEISPNYYWIKIIAKKETDKEYLLEINNATLYFFDVYLVKKDSIRKVLLGGWKYPYKEREIKINNFLNPIHLPQGEIVEIYIRYQSVGQTEIPISFRTPIKVLEGSLVNNLVYGILYGVMIFTIIYYLYIFYSTRNKIYFYYLMYIFFFMIWRSVVHGHANEYYLPDWMPLTWKAANFSFIVGTICMILFALNFLNVKKTAPKFLFISYSFAFVFILLYLIGFYNKYLTIDYINHTYLLLIPFLIFMALYVFVKGYRAARFYLIASTLYLISALIHLFKQLTILPFNFFTQNIVNVGIALEALFLTLALGDQYLESEKKKTEFQKKLKHELELKVEDRRRAHEELKKVNAKLRSANISIDSFLYTATNDIKLYISDINKLIDQLKGEIDNEQEINQNVDKLRELSKKFRSSVEGLANRKIK